MVYRSYFIEDDGRPAGYEEFDDFIEAEADFKHSTTIDNVIKAWVVDINTNETFLTYDRQGSYDEETEYETEYLVARENRLAEETKWESIKSAIIWSVFWVCVLLGSVKVTFHG